MRSAPKPATWAGALAATAVLLLAGCGSTTATEGTTASSAPAAPAAVSSPAGSASGSPAAKGIQTVGAYSGVVKSFFRPKGFGYIVPGVGGSDILFRLNGIVAGQAESIVEGATVSYDTMSGPKGLFAVNVRVS